MKTQRSMDSVSAGNTDESANVNITNSLGPRFLTQESRAFPTSGFILNFVEVGPGMEAGRQKLTPFTQISVQLNTATQCFLPMLFPQDFQVTQLILSTLYSTFRVQRASHILFSCYIYNKPVRQYLVGHSKKSMLVIQHTGCSRDFPAYVLM